MVPEPCLLENQDVCVVLTKWTKNFLNIYGTQGLLPLKQLILNLKQSYLFVVYHNLNILRFTYMYKQKKSWYV